jgi:hypothetical protein
LIRPLFTPGLPELQTDLHRREGQPYEGRGEKKARYLARRSIDSSKTAYGQSSYPENDYRYHEKNEGQNSQ